MQLKLVQVVVRQYCTIDPSILDSNKSWSLKAFDRPNIWIFFTEFNLGSHCVQ